MCSDISFYVFIELYCINTFLLMHLALANLACTFVFQTASFHVTHLHEVVRAHPLHALVTRPKTPPLSAEFSSRGHGQVKSLNGKAIEDYLGDFFHS